MKTLALTIMAAALAGPPALAQDQFDLALQAYTEKLASDCTSFENGTFTAGPDAVRQNVDVNGDGVTDPIVDAGAMSCSSSVTLTAGGNGGREISVFVSQENGKYERFSFLGHGMLPVTLGLSTILIVPKHASACELNGPAPCFAAYTWVDGGFVAGGGKVDGSQAEE